jgi:hypothetical protein
MPSPAIIEQGLHYLDAEGYKRVICGIIDEAVKNMIKIYDPSCSKPDESLADSTFGWLMDDYDGVGGFVWCCDELGLNCEWVRGGILKCVKGNCYRGMDRD